MHKHGYLCTVDTLGGSCTVDIQCGSCSVDIQCGSCTVDNHRVVHVQWIHMVDHVQ